MQQQNGRENYRFEASISSLVNREQRMVEHPVRYLHSDSVADAA